MTRLIWILLVLLFVVGCAQFKGSDGQQGQPGRDGVNGKDGLGMSLIATYRGITAAHDFTVSVPVIKDKPDTTFIMVYFAFATRPTDWIPVTDGRYDYVESSRIVKVNWDTGEVKFEGMPTGQYYLIKVYENV